MTPELNQQVGIAQDQGVVVTRIDPKSAAAMAGLKKGALILAVNRQKVSNVDEFNQILANAANDHPLLFQIKQGDVYLFLSLQNIDQRE